MNRESIIGCILGTAVGDVIGLPYEGLSPRRLRRLYPVTDRHHLLFGKGMVSDDTEHTCMTAQALIESGGDVEAFREDLARRLRWWLLGLPAGIGFGTLRACVKLWLGFPAARSGVFSAGNGPAMRSAIIGAACGRDLQRMKELVIASTRITHTDPKAAHGALAVALAAQMASESRNVAGALFHERLSQALADEQADEFLELVRRAVDSQAIGQPTKEFADSLGLEGGISGYVYHTVPTVIHAWLSHQQDYRSGIMEIVSCGGDADTTGAILGGIVGSGVGNAGIPDEWLRGLWEWPRTVAWMERLGERLHEVDASGRPAQAPRLPVFGIIPRNLFFAIIVIAHGLRRLLPPY